jgi:hypothetical protein
MSPAPNLSRTLFSQGTRKLRVRQSLGAWVDGRWVETADNDRIVRMAVRPISPSDRKLLPEGMQTEDSSVFLTRANQTLAVEQSQANGGTAGDRVWVDGWWWRVVGEKPWAASGYRRYVGIREIKGRERNR